MKTLLDEQENASPQSLSELPGSHMTVTLQTSIDLPFLHSCCLNCPTVFKIVKIDSTKAAKCNMHIKEAVILIQKHQI